MRKLSSWCFWTLLRDLEFKISTLWDFCKNCTEEVQFYSIPQKWLYLNTNYRSFFLLQLTLEQSRELEGPSLHAVQNSHIIYSRPSFHIHRSSESRHSTNHWWNSTVVYTIEKKLTISGPVQLKLVLFKGQLYFNFLFKKDSLFLHNWAKCFCSCALILCHLVEMKNILRDTGFFLTI